MKDPSGVVHGLGKSRNDDGSIHRFCWTNGSSVPRAWSAALFAAVVVCATVDGPVFAGEQYPPGGRVRVLMDPPPAPSAGSGADLVPAGLPSWVELDDVIPGVMPRPLRRSDDFVRDVDGQLRGSPGPRLGFDAVIDSPVTVTPPDTHIAVGPGLGTAGRVVMVTNGEVEIYDKTGASVAGPLPLSTMFGTSVFDPKVLFDEASGNFFIVCLELGWAGPACGSAITLSMIHIAASTGGTPSTLGAADWTFSAGSGLIPIGGVSTWADYPGIGADSDSLFVTTNQFTAACGFVGSNIRVFDKAALIAGVYSFVDITYDAAVTFGVFTIQPAHVYGTTDNGGFYLINRIGAGSYRIYNITGDPAAPVATTTTSAWAAGAFPADTTANQCTVATPDLDTLSSRVQNAVYRNDAGGAGHIWLCLTSNPDGDGQTEVVWQEILTSGGPPAAPVVADSGFIDGTGAANWTYMPSINVDPDLNVAMCFTQSSSTKCPDVSYALREVGAAPGTFLPPAVAKPGPGFYDSFFFDPIDPSRDRWGDYSATVVDPTDDCFWVANEFAFSSVVGASEWGTHIASFCASNEGACCNGPNACAELSAADCAAAGWTFRGVGTKCPTMGVLTAMHGSIPVVHWADPAINCLTIVRSPAPGHRGVETPVEETVVSIPDQSIGEGPQRRLAADNGGSAGTRGAGAIVFDGSPGSGPPPPTLGPYAMLQFGPDGRALFQDVIAVPAPCGGALGLNPPMNHRRIGSGWATWSHGYTGDVYFTNGATSATLHMPADTVAFYFYIEPNQFERHTFQAVANDGTSSGPFTVDGLGGARYVGFYALGGMTIARIDIFGTDAFAVGEFGIACDGTGGGRCGDGIVDAGEQCDPPDGVTCDEFCQRLCIDGPPIDAWTTAPFGQGTDTCHRFGVPGSPEIPAGFFGPGSQPFAGQVCLGPVPLGDTQFGDYSVADTLVRRAADPFDRCDVPSPMEQSVPIEIVALSLHSIQPITVIIGTQPTQWDVLVDLSPFSPPAASTLTAVKTHCNGGTYRSVLHVQPRFTFTRVGDPGEPVVLDTGKVGIPPVMLVQEDHPWTVAPDSSVSLESPYCSGLHPGIEDLNPTTDCDCQPNGRLDSCDIADGFSADCNFNGVPDECDPDADGDFVPDDCDNCPDDPNPAQADADGDQKGDVCDLCPQLAAVIEFDHDGDRVLDEIDNCPCTPNRLQEDADGDGIGDVCDCVTAAACPNADVNCDGIADGFDIAVVRQGVNWLMDTADAAEPRADVNGDGRIDGFDIAAIRQGTCWLH